MMFSMTLYQKLAWSLVIIFSLLCALIFNWSKKLEQHSQHQAQQQLHIHLAEHLVNDNPLIKQGVYDYKALENLFHTLMVLGPAFEYYFVDPEGNLLTYSAKPGKVVRQKISLSPIKKLIAQPSSTPIYGDDPRNVEGQKIFSAAPVYNQQKLQGYLYMIIGGQAFDATLNEVKRDNPVWLGAMWFVAAMVALFITMLLLFRFFTSPLKQLNKEVSRIKAANYSLTEMALSPSYMGNNEIGNLSKGIYGMLSRIDEQFKSLQQIDKQRRELLTHLSHDLRTPLASLYGFLEVIKKPHPHLSEHEQQRYLSLAMDNCQQLKLLIEQIFELANLECGQVKIKTETFNLGELIYDCVAKLALNAEAAGVTIKVTPKICDFPVTADIAKLERVLTNLIENAIRHTPSKGLITVEVSQLNEQVFVSVSDTGVGIHADELTAIFEPHYQARNSIKRGQGGLGLAICKQLLKLMNSDIEVHSTLGKGTQFRFNLTKHAPV